MSENTDRISAKALAAKVRSGVVEAKDALSELEQLASEAEQLREERDAALQLLHEKKGELAVAYGGGRTDDEREWFSALDREKARAERAEAALRELRAVVEGVLDVAPIDEWSPGYDALAAALASETAGAETERGMGSDDRDVPTRGGQTPPGNPRSVSASTETETT